MGLSLSLLGRGDTRGAIRYGIVHVLTAALGGAVVGGALGVIGALLGLERWRFWIVGGVALLALAIALRARAYQLGRQRQVPRRWRGRASPRTIYALWGLMMGCGLYTPVYHTALLVLLATQLTGGVGYGLLSGAIFGFVRQLTALWPVARRLEPNQTMSLLERLRPIARGLNFALIVAVLAVLAFAAVR
ncbi:MAG: hypothetical protein IT337_06585 [Thermomicrobiales bacterium]|nr:hypothetical protein [Thermomicrobiales bacterium]